MSSGDRKRPFISVIVLCYNYGHLLQKTLSGIASQTYRDFEVVFVNNGSTDNTANIASAFKENHPELNINIITVPKNKGAAHGENIGVQAAKGEYLMFHDADDWMDSNTLELLAAAAKRENADRVIAAFRDVDENGKVTQVQNLGKQPNKWLYGMQQANLFRTKIYRENRIETKTFWLDAEKTFLFSAYSDKTAYVYEPCYNYLVHLDSTSRNKNLYMRVLTDSNYSFEEFIKICLPAVDYVKDTPDEIFAKYQLARYYFSYIFQFVRDAPFKEKIHIYNILHDTIQYYVPDYLEKTRQALQYKKATRPYARKVALLASYLERFHLMKLGLLGYHILSKIVYFQV